MESKKGGTRDQERRQKEKRLMRIWGGEERITRDRLCHVKLPLSTHVLSFPCSPSLPLSVDNTIVNHRGIDYEGLIFSTSEQEHDCGSGGEVASAVCA